MLSSALVVAVIPARGGSKGLRGKHLRTINGVPLITYTIRAARLASRVDRVLCSTDDKLIAITASRAGAEVPFIRPAHLATDEAPTVAVIKHALEWLDAERLRVEVIVTLQPTSPLRTAREIDTAVGLLDEPGIDSAVSVASIGLPVSVVGWIEGDRYRGTLSSMSDLRRQGSPVAVRLTGGIYVTRRELIEKNRIMGERPAALLVNERSAIDVDTLSDLRAVRRIIGHRS